MNLRLYWDRWCARWISALLLLAAFGMFYVLPNKFGTAEPWLVPWTALDRLIPFQPALVWVYFCSYFLVCLSYLFFFDDSDVPLFQKAFLLCGVAGTLCFWFLPTYVEREPFPVDPARGYSEAALYSFRFMDDPRNGMPSFHVALSCLAAWFLARAGRRAGAIGWTIAVAIVYSTLAVKQHALYDVLSGFVLFLLVTAVARRLPTASRNA